MCGKPFHSQPSENQRFCSRQCRSKSERKYKICKHCGVRYWKQRTGHSIYCSKACFLADTHVPKQEFTCRVCGKTRMDRPGRGLTRKHMYCSLTCAGIDRVRMLSESKEPTGIEAATYQALRDLGIEFLPQYKLGPWLVDAYIPSTRTVIECFGDFFHANPNMYDHSSLYPVQQRNMSRDNRKLGWLRGHAYRTVVLWESDIEAVGASALLERAGITYD